MNMCAHSTAQMCTQHFVSFALKKLKKSVYLLFGHNLLCQYTVSNSLYIYPTYLLGYS